MQAVRSVVRPRTSGATRATITPSASSRCDKRLRQLNASHGRYEVRGLRAEGKDWPAPILRGVAGDGDAARDIAGLLDDADPAIRRKAAELLFELRRPETAPALRLALGRDEDPRREALVRAGAHSAGAGGTPGLRAGQVEGPTLASPGRPGAGRVGRPTG